MLRAAALYTLADLLQMELDIELDKENLERVRGYISYDLDINGYGFEVPLNVTSSYIGPHEVGLLIEGPGNLLMIVAFTKNNTKKVYLLVLDRSLIKKTYRPVKGLLERFMVKNLATASKMFANAYKASYVREEGQGWKPLGG